MKLRPCFASRTHFGSAKDFVVRETLTHSLSIAQVEVIKILKDSSEESYSKREITSRGAKGRSLSWSLKAELSDFLSHMDC